MVEGTTEVEVKIRNGFVSNSSSTAFIVTNNTAEDLTLIEFVYENPQLIEQYLEEYGWDDTDVFTQANLLASARDNNETLKPGSNYVIFGDEQGSLIGRVFDYILREGGDSTRFAWRYKEALR